MKNLPDTGQTLRFAAGDDSEYTIHPPALRKNDDGTVSDEVTGLVWQQADGGEMVFERAKEYCAALRTGDFSDWRLPSNRELFSILNHQYAPPAVDASIFGRPEAEYWWSADLRADDASRVWAVNAGGGTGPHPRNETLSAGGTKRFHVRCVRQTETRMVEDALTANGDGTVTDNRTGLNWQQGEAPAPMTWEQALEYVRGLEGGWRLPNIRELQSLHDETAVQPAISRIFPEAQRGLYWSSTTQITRAGDRAWTVDFALGIVSYNEKTQRLRVRAVRGGE